MAYSDFTLAKVKANFNLRLNEDKSLFDAINPIEVSDFLKQTLKEYLPLATAINTEKARSELIIAPILTEVWRQLNYQVGFFSGTDFNVDSGLGLTGYCDFIISADKEQFFINAPVVTITEAKNENIKSGLGQCIAAMVAASMFNQANQNPIDVIYGAVTTGTAWRFITLSNQDVSIDSIEYYVNQLEKIIGILLHPFSSVEFEL